MQRIGLVLVVGLVAATTSCASEVTPETDPSSSGSATEEPSGTTPGDTDTQDRNPDEDADTQATCDDDAFTGAATIPQQLADLDVPFYACVHEMASMPGSDPLFVGEYDTDHESIVIEMEFKDMFEASDWDVTENTVEGDNAVTQAQKEGYLLTVAIGPSRTVDGDSSIHYTLRQQ